MRGTQKGMHAGGMIGALSLKACSESVLVKAADRRPDYCTQIMTVSIWKEKEAIGWWLTACGTLERRFYN